MCSLSIIEIEDGFFSLRQRFTNTIYLNEKLVIELSTIINSLF